MAGDPLLDTNIVTALFNVDPDVAQEIRRTSRIAMPVIVLGELLWGARNSGRVDANVARIEEFAARVRLVACDADTARFYGAIKAQLRAKGRPIPDNDIWIAATAQQHGLTLVTRDSDFAQVDGLSVERW